MARDGSGTYSVPNVFLPNTVMSATAVNTNFTDAGTAITGSLARDGQSSMTGQLKAAAGTVGAPGISFGVDPDTGFRRASEDEMRWVTGGADRFYIDSTGKAFHLGAMDISGDIGLSAPIVIATTSASLLTLRRTENDTTARIVEEWHSGSGAGAKATLEVVGDGNNAVSTLRWRVNAAAVFEATQSLFTADVPLAVGSSLRFDSGGFIDLTEIAVPSAPSANVARLYAVDVSGATKLQFKDAAGSLTSIPAAADLQVFTGSGTWTKPASGTIAFVQVWGSGASGGRAGNGDAGGGGGGGGYAELYIAVASLSASVSVTIAAGGAAQTSDNTSGNSGGASSFGAYIAAGGGGPGDGTDTADNWGGGGGGLSTNNGVTGATTGNGGSPLAIIGLEIVGQGPNNSNPFGGAAGGSEGNVGGTALMGGAGGGGGNDTAAGAGGGGGVSVYGGGGGGGGSDSGAGGAGGFSVLYGGNGGAGATGAAAATAGTAPGGGGGGSETGNSGAGARGEVRVMVW